MKLTQNWVGYLDRSYQQIKASILNRITVEAPEITDFSESNPLIILISSFSGVGEMLNLYIDSNAREAFLGTCRRYTSAVKLVRLIDYNIKARGYASANLLFTLIDTTTGNPTTHTAAILIPKDTLVSVPGSSTDFRTVADINLPIGQSSVYDLASQYDELSGVTLGVTNGTNNQSLALPDNYVHGSMTIVIDSEDWVLYNSFGLMVANTKGFVVEIDEDKQAWVVFGDGINGKVPTINKNVVASYKITEGILGNLSLGTLTSINTTITTPSGKAFKVNNPDYASGGTDFEGLEDIRNRAPRSIRTLDRAVTKQDYVDVALQVPGVGAAAVDYSCGKFVDLYIVPTTRGVATNALLTAVRNYINPRKMITTQVDVKPGGIVRVWIQGKVYGKTLFTSTQIQKEVLEALDTNFGMGVTQINKRVSATDIIAVMEDLKTVDTFELEKLKIEPFARPVNNTSNTLVITWLVLPTSTVAYKYTLIYITATGKFQLYKAGVYLADITIGTPYTDGGYTSFRIDAGTYSNNDKWEFTVYPSYPEIFPSTLINLNDFSAPLIDVSPKIDEVTPRTIFSSLTYITQ